MTINKVSKALYKGGRMSRNVKAVSKSIQQGSIMPIIKRLINMWIGRNIVNKLWMK